MISRQAAPARRVLNGANWSAWTAIIFTAVLLPMYARDLSPPDRSFFVFGLNLERMLRFGGLPAVWADAPTDAARIDFLEAYAENYLTQEIRQEGLVKNLESFSRFLEIASLVNAQVVNVAGVARDAGVASRSPATSAERCSKPGCCTSFARIRTARAAAASSATGELLPGRKWTSSGPEPHRASASR